MEHSISELREKYFKAILLLTDEQDIVNILPNPTYKKVFYSLINGILELLDEKINDLQNQIGTFSADDGDILFLATEELEHFKWIKQICENYRQDVLDGKLDGNSELVQGQVKNLIFAQTSFGNICLERDIKTFPEEYLESVASCLKKIELGFEENNSVKGKKMTHDHNLQNIHEIKEFKVRVLYKLLTPDTAYVIMAKMKKADFSKKDREEISNRNKGVDDEFEFLKKVLTDPKEKARIIAEHEEIYKRLISIIDKKKRGRNV